MSEPERIIAIMDWDGTNDGVFRNAGIPAKPPYDVTIHPKYVHEDTHREELAQVWDAVAYLCREGLDVDTIRETAERAAAAQRAGAEKSHVGKPPQQFHVKGINKDGREVFLGWVDEAGGWWQWMTDRSWARRFDDEAEAHRVKGSKGPWYNNPNPSTVEVALIPDDEWIQVWQYYPSGK